MENMTTTPKLIFFDIDGTLLTEGKNPYVPESTRKALRLLRSNGHICLINTGWPFAALDQLIKNIEVDGYVCGCGTYMKLNGKVLFVHHLDMDLCYRTIIELNNCNLEWMLEGEDKLYYSDKPYSTKIGPTVSAMHSKIPNSIYCITESDYNLVQFDKFIMNVRQDSDLATFQKKFSNEYTFIDRGDGLYEVIPMEYSKATGMKFFEEYLNISHDDTIAVGDSANDISMLQYANLSILMGNSTCELHKYADYVTDDITSDGIYNAFRHFGLI